MQTENGKGATAANDNAQGMREANEAAKRQVKQGKPGPSALGKDCSLANR
jgi:hypothetical protein